MATPTINWYYYTGSTWTDITDYVRGGVTGHWGMGSSKPTDRLARVGEMMLTLDNTNGEFDPEDGDCLTGWAKNAKVRMDVTYDGSTWRRFYGTVADIKFVEPNKFDHTAKITVVDWMGYPYKFNLTEKSILTYKTGDYAVDDIVDAVGVAPLKTQYSAGAYLYDALYDSMTPKTKASTELNKIVLSEMGYLYTKHDKANGETLTFETADDRNGLRTVAKLPKMKTACAYLTDEDGNYLTDESGNRLLSNDVDDAHINGTAQGYSRTHGENIINSVTITAYPKRIDDTEQTLYKLGTPIKLSAGETKTVKISYYNATTKESCNAITDQMIQPVATTDYTMNRKEDGTGTDLTADLTVSVVYHTAEGEVTLVNGSAYTGYVRKLICRGYGVYQDSNLKATIEDTTSITAYSEYNETIDQQYQRDTASGEIEGAKIVEAEKDPRTRLEKITMIANSSDTHMMAFLAIDIGDMVQITESTIGVSGLYYYVQGIDFSIAGGNIITFTWTLGENLLQSFLEGGLTATSLEFTDGSNQVVNFGVVKSILNLQERSILLSVNPHSRITRTEDAQTIVQIGSNIYSLSTNPFEKIDLMFQTGETNLFIYFWDQLFTGNTIRAWSTSQTTPEVPQDTWSRIAVTFKPPDSTAVPAIYVDGTLCTLYNSAPVPYLHPDTEDGLELHIGGYYAGATIANNFDGLIKDVKIYNRILTAAEIAQDAAGTPVTDGLVFHALGIPTGDTAAYYDAALTESQKLYDNIHGNIGTPKGAPTCREIV